MLMAIYTGRLHDRIHVSLSGVASSNYQETKLTVYGYRTIKDKVAITDKTLKSAGLLFNSISRTLYFSTLCRPCVFRVTSPRIAGHCCHKFSNNWRSRGDFCSLYCV